jgi:hypothetical protein
MSVDSKEKGIALLKTTKLVSVVAGAETILYTATGKRAVVTDIAIRDPDASLAGCTSAAFGTNAGTRNDWDSTARTFALVTGVTLCMVTRAAMVADTAEQASTIVGTTGTFGVKVTANSGSATTATFDVFGYLLDD